MQSTFLLGKTLLHLTDDLRVYPANLLFDADQEEIIAKQFEFLTERQLQIIDIAHL
jgi:hypothetical protein